MNRLQITATPFLHLWDVFVLEMPHFSCLLFVLYS